MYVLYEHHEIFLMESEDFCYKDDQEKYMHYLFKKYTWLTYIQWNFRACWIQY